MRRAPRPPRYLWFLLVLFGILAALAAAVPARPSARALFQSPFQSPPGQSVPSPTLPAFSSTLPTVTPSATRLLSTRTVPPTSTPSPTPSPSPSPTETPVFEVDLTATAVAASFLPPPTLTSGDPFRPGGLFPGAAAPLSAPPVTPIARPAGTNPDANPPAAGGLARLIDRGALLLTYVWLGCGALTVAGLVVGAVWFLRRHP